ncbi:MAG: SpoIIE family protein phosphatase, partial [Pirellulales bacterium]
AEVSMTSGCTLVLYTDGISEAMDHKNELYGLGRLKEVLSGPADSPAAVGRRLLVDVERHAAGQVRSDDMCLVCVGRPAAT